MVVLWEGGVGVGRPASTGDAAAHVLDCVPYTDGGLRHFVSEKFSESSKPGRREPFPRLRARVVARAAAEVEAKAPTPKTWNL